ncbi:MAG: hypothetical protein Q7S22_05940 [Candidatus Micrarchaeota archaeon]|nr:hypothetical protein [Candidatus Micrarchaeota archaeon]
MSNLKLKLFICTSITHKLGKPDEIAKLQGLVETIDRTAQQRNAVTWCAFREEGWKGEETPTVYVPRDFGWAKKCDGAILIPEDSWGVRIEEGWLSALEKPMLRLFENEVVHRTGIEEHLGILSRVFDGVFHTTQDIEGHVNEFIDFLEGLKI